MQISCLTCSHAVTPWHGSIASRNKTINLWIRQKPVRFPHEQTACSGIEAYKSAACEYSGGHGRATGGKSGGGGGKGWSRWWNSWDGGNRPGFRLSLLCMLLTCRSLEAQALGRNRHGKTSNKSWAYDQEVDQYATHLTQLAWPVLQNLGFSGAVGLVCAVAFKAIGRVVAVGLGTMFAVIQVLAYRGYITVDWSKMHEDILRICDVNQDGKFEATDMRTALASLLAAASQGLPSISGFCLGFGLGLRF